MHLSAPLCLKPPLDLRSSVVRLAIAIAIALVLALVLDGFTGSRCIFSVPGVQVASVCIYHGGFVVRKQGGPVRCVDDILLAAVVVVHRTGELDEIIGRHDPKLSLFGALAPIRGKQHHIHRSCFIEAMDFARDHFVVAVLVCVRARCLVAQQVGEMHGFVGLGALYQCATR